MKIFYIFITFLLFFNLNNSFGQSENCSAATPISITATCVSPTNGSSGLTQNIPGCVGNADDDVWYEFVATGTSHQINVIPSTTMDAVVQLFSGGCAVLATISCMDASLAGGTETINATGLTIGNTYKFRIYHYGVGTGSSTFTVCVTNPPPSPVNDNCSGATVLSINAACVNTTSTTVGATQSMIGCSGNADDDVWFAFVATNTTATITVDPSSLMDPVVELYSGNCASLNSIQCEDVGFTNGNEVINAIGLIPGNTYFVRVYDYFGGGGFPFDICVTGAGVSPVPTNDEPCNAIALPTVTSACNYLQFSTIGSTASLGAPTPSSCVGGSGAQIGSFSAGSHDIWFSVVAPANGQIAITMQPNFGINDGVMVLYSGTCGSLTQITCSDDNNYPGGGNDFKPYINESGLTPGSTYFVRYFGFGTSAGDFGFCVSSPTNDDCSNALAICDLNGYSASTSAAYTADRPSNMRANAELNDPPTYTYAPGSNSGGVFGQGGAWGTGAPLFDVQINNNSWIKFTASNTTAILNVAIGNCWIGNYPSGGIQMQVFSATNCTNFVPVSNFQEGSSNFTITANSLIIGNDYYLMIDGYAGDICNYTISANSGVQFTDIKVNRPNICFGDTTKLIGPALASSYLWMPGGATTPDITVSPSTTTTYTLTAEGACGNKQTFTKTITVNPFPTANLLADDTLCTNETLNLNGNPSGGISPYTHTWTGTGQALLNNSSIVNPLLTPTTAGNYTLYYEVSDPIGCSFQDTMDLVVNATPTINITGNTSICSGTSDTLTATGGGTYTWNTGSSSDTTVISPTVNTTYTVIVTGTNGCIDSTNQIISVNTIPTPSINGSNVICLGNTTTLTASGGTSYSWNNGAITPTITVSPIVDSTYLVTVMNGGGCTDTISVLVQVVSNPTASITGIDTICVGIPTTLTASGGGTYVWNNGFISSSINVSPTADSTYSVIVDAGGCFDTTDITVIVNQLPTIAIISAGSSNICTGSTDTLTATGGGTYSWNTGSSSDTTIVSPTTTTNYTVTVTDTNGCINTNNINIQVDNLPTASISSTSTNICLGGSTTLTASGGGTYQWNNGFTTPAITVSPNTDSTYIVTVTNTAGCEDTSSVFVQVVSNPTASITGIDTICVGIPTTLTASGGGTYVWNNGFISSSINVSPTADSTYSVIVDAGGCFDTTDITVIVNQLPIVTITSAGNNTVCIGSTDTLTATGGSTYSWSTGSSSDTTVISPATNTNYIVTVTDTNGCINTDNISILVNNLPTVSITSSSNSVCQGNSTTLTALGGGSYQWNNGLTTSAISVSPTTDSTYVVTVTNTAGCEDTASTFVQVLSNPIANITGQAVICDQESTTLTGNGGGSYLWNTSDTTQSITITPNDTTIYTLTVNVNGCTGDTTFTVSVTPLPNIFAFNDTTVILGQSATIHAQGVTPYTWTPTENLSCTNCADPIATPKETTTYCVSNTENNCINTSCVTVFVDVICGALFVPNAFSPNGDGENDCLKVYSNCIETVLFRVYSRWGQLIYESDEVGGCWDGTKNGSELNTGTYVYTVSGTLINGDQVEIKGNTTLFK